MNGDQQALLLKLLSQNPQMAFHPSLAAFLPQIIAASRGQQQPQVKEEISEDGLPKESEAMSRKRPAAIQELMQMKKKRLDERGSSKGNSPPSSPSASIPNHETASSTSSSADHSESPEPSMSLSLIGASDDQEFTKVPGRLSLLSSATKHSVTVGEVRRRLNGPEAFNMSLLGAVLRRAKMPEKSQSLVSELANVGLGIPRGRRRKANVTLFSAFTEAESIKLVEDFNSVSTEFFPVAGMAEHALRQNLENREQLNQLKEVKNCITTFVDLLSLDRSPIGGSSPNPVFDHTLQDPLSNFSMLTHGFGTPPPFSSAYASSSATWTLKSPSSKSKPCLSCIYLYLRVVKP
ncbi:hypothetical protein L596_026520 [Steinernema carpocapsae]|uniref:Transcription factor AP-2 C-terminal domain-containing protein n=1 Tax=Steinernema carpocapsae TaxID=34508 RepID=A0A4U5M1M4_STECR|nr:hypothetical protein L596_026520 [Steinernema carpocapsae]